METLRATARLVTTLMHGMAFGEMSMLCPGLPRTKTIRTETICEVYAITYNDFNQMLELFPGFARDMRKLAVERGLTAKMLKDLPAEPVELSQDGNTQNIAKEDMELDEKKRQKDTMRRLDRQLVAVADMLRSLTRRT